MFTIVLRIAVILLLPYSVSTYTSWQVLWLSSLVWRFSAQSPHLWSLSLRSYDMLSIFQIALVMGPSLYFFLRQYHLQPSNTSALFVTVVMSAAVLSILTSMYSGPINVDYDAPEGNIATELSACTAMSLAAFTVVPSMRNMALEYTKTNNSNVGNRSRREMNPGVVLALLCLFAPSAFALSAYAYDIDRFGLGFGSFAPAMTASGNLVWPLQSGSPHADLRYFIGNHFSLPYPGVLYFLVGIWMARSALGYAHSDVYRRSYELSIMATLALYVVSIALWSFLVGEHTGLWLPPFPLFAVITILWTRRVRSITVPGAYPGVEVAWSLGAETTGSAFEEGYDPETRRVRVPVYYVVVSRIKRRKQLRE